MKEKILIIDDEPEVLELLARTLSDEGFEVVKACSGNEAVAIFETGSFDLVITDMKMPGLRGIDVLHHIKQIDNYVEVIILTGYGCLDDAILAMRDSGAHDYFLKPLDQIEGLLISVGNALERRKLRLEGKYLLEKLASANAELEHGIAQRTIKLEKTIAMMETEIAERKQITKALRESEKKYRTLCSNIPGMVYRAKSDWSTEIISNCEMVCGYSADEFNSRQVNWLDLIFTEDKSQVFEEGSKMLEKSMSIIQEYRILHKDGSTRWVSDHKISLYNKDGSFICLDGIVFDITQRNQAEYQIKASLKEKEVLLAELYHRTKNNMQVISGLLFMQSMYIEDEQILDIFKETDNRIRAMSLVHEKLYHAKNLSSINLKEYIKDLADQLLMNYEIKTERISFTVEGDPVLILMDTAVPCGLILNELITNSLMHAFPDDRKGEIQISIHTLDDGDIEIWFKDNGVGLPKDFDLEKTQTLGLELVRDLTKSQLKGKIVIKPGPGMDIQIRFKKKLYKKRI